MTVFDVGMGEPIRWDEDSLTAEEIDSFVGVEVGKKRFWRGIMVKIKSTTPLVIEELVCHCRVTCLCGNTVQT